MQNEKLRLTVHLRQDRFLPCVQYIFDLFSRVYGHTINYSTGKDSPSPPADVFIYYTDENSPQDINAGQVSITLGRSAFFTDTFGKSNTPPLGFEQLIKVSKETTFASIAERSASTAHLSQDIIAAAFYLLSGYHDWTTAHRDIYGRSLASDVPLPSETWEIPHVNHWFRQLHELLCSLHRPQAHSVDGPRVPAGLQTICLTHDVDLMRKYRFGRLPRHLLRTAKTNPSAIRREAGYAMQVLRGREPDPYDCFDRLYTVKERISAPSTFFFLGSAPGARNGDYEVNGRESRNLMTRARSFGDEIAMHGSWDSPENCAIIRAEKDAVQRVAQNPVLGSRQHYLRFSTPDTWDDLAQAGIRYDSTGGFPDRCGFKYGWSGCFHPFNLDTMTPIPILEIPLICMDVTLANYEKIPSELALERLSTLLDSACDNVPGGAFVFLWHNTTGDRVAYPGYFDTFEYFFSVASGSARYITLSHLCDEFDGTGAPPA